MFRRNKQIENDMNSNEYNKPPKNKGGIVKKILFGVILVVFIGVIASFIFKGKGGGGEEVENKEQTIDESVLNSPVPIGVISSDLNNIVNKEDKLDEIVIKKLEPLEFTDKHKKVIESKVSGKAKPYLMKVDALGRSVAYDLKFQYEVLYVEISKDWHLLYSEPLNQEDWAYIPTEGVRVSRVRESLKEVNFPGFEEGFVGDMETSEVEILNSKTDLDNLKDIVELEVVIQTEFANYKLKEEVEYSYKNNEWQIENEHDLINSNNWDINYLTKEKPKSHSKEYIMGLVSNEESYFSKVVNLKNAKSYTLNEPKHIPSQTGVGLKYGLNVEYEDLSIITYDILVPIEWTGASWVDKEVSIDVGSAVFNNMLGMWFSKETGDIIILKDVEPFINEGDKRLQKISGVLYEKQEDLSLKEKEIIITPDIPLRSQAFAGKFSKIENSSFSDKDIVFDLTKSTLESNEVVFRKADKLLGYKSDIDIEKIIKETEITEKEIKEQKEEAKKEMEELEKKKKDEKKKDNKEKEKDKKDKIKDDDKENKEEEKLDEIKDKKEVKNKDKE